MTRPAFKRPDPVICKGYELLPEDFILSARSYDMDAKFRRDRGDTAYARRNHEAGVRMRIEGATYAEISAFWGGISATRTAKIMNKIFDRAFRSASRPDVCHPDILMKLEQEA